MSSQLEWVTFMLRLGMIGRRTLTILLELKQPSELAACRVCVCLHAFLSSFVMNTYLSLLHRQHKKELQELRKKKVQKKVARLQEIEESREKEKLRWKEFAHRSGKKGAPIGGKQKRSIFAVPDSIHGKVCNHFVSHCCLMFPPIQVGVGTCNVGGKGMTGYVQPKGYTKSAL